MLNCVIVCLSVICTSVMFSAIFKRSFEQTASLAVITNTLILYAIGLTGLVRIGVYAVLIISALFMLFAMFISIGQGDGFELLMNVFSVGLAVFVIAAGALFLYLRGTAELNSYGDTAETIVRLLSFDGTFRDVPVVEGIGAQPGYALFVYMFTALSGTYQYQNAVFGAGIFAISMILPVVGKIRWKRAYLALIIFPVMAAVLFIGGKNFPVIGAINGDAGTILVFAMMLMTYMCCEQCGYVYWTLGLGNAMLLVMRPGSEFLVLLMFLIILIDIAALGFWEVGELFATASKWISVIFYFLITTLAFISWWIYAGTKSIPRLFGSIQMTAERGLAFSGRAGQVFRAFFQGKAILPYWLWMVIFVAVAVGAAFLAKGFWNRIRTGIQAAIVLLSLVVFMFVLAFAYTHIYPIATNIKESVDIYLTAYVMAALIFVVGLTANKFMNRFFTE